MLCAPGRSIERSSDHFFPTIEGLSAFSAFSWMIDCFLTTSRADTSAGIFGPDHQGVEELLQLRHGEKSKPVPNMDDPTYSHVHIEPEVEGSQAKPN